MAAGFVAFPRPSSQERPIRLSLPSAKVIRIRSTTHILPFQRAHSDRAWQARWCSALDRRYGSKYGGPSTYLYAHGVQHQFGGGWVASVGYTGSHSTNLLTGSVLNQFPGTDINRFAGDLITNNNVLTRLNQSFGSIGYTTNGNTSTYNAFIATLEKRFAKGGLITASYTRSSSWDDGQQYPDQNMISHYWQPSVFDVPNRFSFTGAYPLAVHKMDSRALNCL